MKQYGCFESDVDSTPATIRVRCDSCQKIEPTQTIAETVASDYDKNEDGTYTNHFSGECFGCMTAQSKKTVQIGEALTPDATLNHNDLLSFLTWLCAHGADISEYEDFDFTSENTLSPYEQIVTNYLGDPKESKHL